MYVPQFPQRQRRCQFQKLPARRRRFLHFSVLHFPVIHFQRNPRKMSSFVGRINQSFVVVVTADNYSMITATTCAACAACLLGLSWVSYGGSGLARAAVGTGFQSQKNLRLSPQNPHPKRTGESCVFSINAYLSVFYYIATVRFYCIVRVMYRNCIFICTN